MQFKFKPVKLKLLVVAVVGLNNIHFLVTSLGIERENKIEHTQDELEQFLTAVKGLLKVECIFFVEGSGNMKMCQNCGLGIEDNNDLITCFKYKTLNNSQEDKTNCLYFIERIIEDGEPLPQIQHLLLVEQELGKRKMKISIKMVCGCNERFM